MLGQFAELWLPEPPEPELPVLVEGVVEEPAVEDELVEAVVPLELELLLAA
jgi:hypothetical protein